MFPVRPRRGRKGESAVLERLDAGGVGAGRELASEARRDSMSDEEDYMDDSEEGDDDEYNDTVFDLPTVQHQESVFHVLTPDDCDAAAKQQVQSVQELLCCDADVAHILLRQFRWDRDKLTDGARRLSSCLRTSCCAAPSAPAPAPAPGPAPAHCVRPYHPPACRAQLT